MGWWVGGWWVVVVVVLGRRVIVACLSLITVTGDRGCPGLEEEQSRAVRARCQ